MTQSVRTTFRDRAHAGQSLAALLPAHSGVPGVLVLGLPRGGVPVAAEVARTLGAQLDICLVRKLGVAGRPELAMGAVATGGVTVLNRGVLAAYGVTDEELAEAAAREHRELERRLAAYRVGPPPAIEGRTVILVDDGLATGSTMRAACSATRLQSPASVIAAVPVAPRGTAAALRDVADEVVVAVAAEHFGAVGEWYDDFTQTTDDEVRALLASAR